MTNAPDIPVGTRPSLAESLLAAGAILAVAAWLTTWAIVNPSDMPGWFRCPLHHLTGLLCPGCGSTRATHLLLNGQPGYALRHNPLAVLIGLPSAAVLVILAGRTLLGARTRLPLSPWVAWAVLAAVVLFWIARNVPVAALDPLRPPAPRTADDG